MKAIDLLKMCNEAEGTLEIGSIKAGDQVMYADGHEFEGMVAVVIGIHPETSTVDLKVGSGTRMDVSVSDLVSTPHVSNASAPAGASSEAPADLPTESHRRRSHREELTADSARSLKLIDSMGQKLLSEIEKLRDHLEDQRFPQIPGPKDRSGFESADESVSNIIDMWDDIKAIFKKH